MFTQSLCTRLANWADLAQVLPESQAGFRAGRSCTDNIFVLLSAVQLQLRLGARNVFGLFIDFKRAFDSVPHILLWTKLFKLGVSTKIIRILQDLYSKATVRVRVGDEVTESVPVTEGVLQGETLSPLLFILYLSDIETFFRENGCIGLNIDGYNDVLMLLYADDLIIFAHSPEDQRKKLRVLEKYCKLNKLVVNIGKTKIVVFRSGGRAKFADSLNFEYENKNIEIVSSYDYLGIPIISSALGYQAAKNAIGKTKLASGTCLSILGKGKSNSWDATTKLFDSIGRSTLLYAVPAWGLPYLDTLEVAQMYFFKRFLLLPSNTANGALRLELNIDRIAYSAIRLIWGWLIRVLKMNNTRLPKICLLRLIALANAPNAKVKYNWAAQLRAFLISLDLQAIWDRLEPEFLTAQANEVFDKYKTFLKNQDFQEWVARSSALPLTRSSLDACAGYIYNRCPIAMIRVKAQIRLSNNYICRIICNNCVYKLTPEAHCRVCTRHVNETIAHFLMDCPTYNIFRNYYLREYVRTNNICKALLDNFEPAATKALFYFVTSSLKLRAFMLNE